MDPMGSWKKTIGITQRRFTAKKNENASNYRDDFLKCFFEEYKRITDCNKRLKDSDIFWTKCLKIDCHTHSEQTLWSFHIALLQVLYTTYKNWTAWIFAMSGAQQKTHSCIKLHGFVFDKRIPWISWIFKKNGQDALHDLLKKNIDFCL